MTQRLHKRDDIMTNYSDQIQHKQYKFVSTTISGKQKWRGKINVWILLRGQKLFRHTEK